MLTGVILGVAVICWIYVYYQKKTGNLIANRRWIEQLPSLVSKVLAVHQ